MSEDDLLDIVERYGDALALAIKAVTAWGCYVSYPDTAKFFISEDDQVVVTSWRATSDSYDGYELEEDSDVCPLAFMLADEAGRAEMLEARRLEREQEARAQNALERARREASERAAYEALKAKFG